MLVVVFRWCCFRFFFIFSCFDSYYCCHTRFLGMFFILLFDGALYMSLSILYIRQVSSRSFLRCCREIPCFGHKLDGCEWFCFECFSLVSTLCLWSSWSVFNLYRRFSHFKFRCSLIFAFTWLVDWLVVYLGVKGSYFFV